ncbi:MAG TPA: tetratricopeptide repeat protein [Polyangiaceae bacterium]|nr:tetratricopeptide repeat protein [Polyangiaceae bacterium]
MSTDEERDAEHWSAIEDAVELLLERQYEKALLELRDVLKRDPSNAYAYHHLGNALYDLGQLEPARDAYRAAVRHRPHYLAARIALSHVLRKLGSFDAAMREANQALQRFPGDGEAHFASGMALAACGERDRARFHLERFLASHPELEAALEARGVLAMLERGDDDEPFELA